MKHSYRPECTCERCEKERARRGRQAAHDSRGVWRQAIRPKTTREQVRASRQPAAGTQEWAETRGDDIDSPSGDY